MNGHDVAYWPIVLKKSAVATREVRLHSVAARSRTANHDGTSASRTGCFFYEFSLERHVPTDHLLRSIDRFVELGELRQELAALLQHDGPTLD